MKQESTYRHIQVGISNIFDYSPFGAPLDGRTIQNTFYQASTSVDTVKQTVYALNETFDVASDWQATTSYSQITYPSGKMRVRNSSTVKRTIGAKKNFVTGEGLHEVSFDITSLPSLICEYQPPFPPIGIGINSDSTTTTSGIGGNATLNVVVKNQNSVTITSGSYTTTGTFTNINFTAVEGDTYTLEFYINNACKNTFFQVDNVFISYEEVIITQTVYALEETFDVASDWQATTSYSQITYPSGKMRVRNSSTVKRTIGAKKSFVTGEGLHEVSFDITSLPSPICSIIRPPIIRSNSDSTTTTSGIGGNATLNVVVKNQNSVTITSGSYTTTGNFTNINFTAVEGDTYTIEFYINNACKNTFFQVDNVFISHKEEVNIEAGSFIVSGDYRYGFNGMERDDNVKGAGNHYDLGLRNYDPRIGRMFSIDPRANEYPWQTTYAYHRNSPIMMIDYLGGGDADGIYIDEETGVVLGEDEFGADDGLVHYTSRENWNKYGGSPRSKKSKLLKEGGISKTINLFDEIANELESSGGRYINGIKITEFTEDVGLGVNYIVNMITTSAESTINTKFRYPDPKAVTEAANKSLKALSNTVQKFALFYTVTDKSLKMANALFSGDVESVGHHAVTVTGYIISYRLMSTPNPYVVGAGVVVYVGTSLYDFFNKPEPKD